MSVPLRVFQLDAETVASLREAVAANPEKLKRLERRLARDRVQAARRSELEQRIDRLRAKNAALREAAWPLAPHQASEDAAAPSGPHSLVADDFDEATIRTDVAAVPATWGRHVSLFRYGGPSLKGTVSPVIDEGILYRILTDEGGWAFYNDTRYYSVEVRYRLAAGSTVMPGPSTSVRGKGEEQELAMQLGPEETKVLFTGCVVDFKNLCKASLLPRHVATAQEDEVLCAEPLQHLSALTSSYSDAAFLNHSRVSPTQLVAHCVAKQVRFVDLDFLPSHASLYRDCQDSLYVAPLHWRLPGSYLPDDDSVRRELRLFRGPVLHPNGLRAGHLLSGHRLLSVAVALACHWPQALRRLFIHPLGAQQGKRERAVGAYHVSLCIGGWWQPWVVDEFLPASASCPEFSHSADDLRLLWLPLLEKACAKSLGSYAAMLDAPLEYFVAALTGGPCMMLREIWPAREDLRDSTAQATRFFATMTRLLRHFTREMPSVVCWLRPFLLNTARTEEKRDRLEMLYGDVGLDPTVATVVLGLETLSNGQCIVRLRQTAEQRKPAEAWLDLWRHAGKSWVDEVSDLVFAMEETEGETVWMALEDLPQYFQGGCVAPLTNGWGAVKVRGKFAQHQPSVVLQVTVTAQARLVVTVTQGDLEREPLSPTLGAESFLIRPSRGLEGLSCVLYSKGRGDSPHFLGGSSESPDAFDLAERPHFAYERDVTTGHLLDPSEGPYYVVPLMHPTSSEVAYTLTTQLIGAVPQSVGPPHAAPESGTATVRFMAAKSGMILVQNSAQPILRGSSMEVSPMPMNYQWCSPKQQCMHDGIGVAVTFALSGCNVP
ncbi:hypothetical protein JKF63_03782 [Porcisia hertigi]|uniref:Calpain catalytic domain-containing protein n=1 Tax=Porcisia hertigi TaxID=2761500 RepID=A0A836ILU0_9TRYP|nr:hypothetical protein JKF63_03782 [Porcisia hertigi]